MSETQPNGKQERQKGAVQLTLTPGGIAKDMDQAEGWPIGHMELDFQVR
jgi:hypothetical protein